MHDASVETEESHAGKVLLRYLFLYEYHEYVINTFQLCRIVTFCTISSYFYFIFLDHGTKETNIFFQRVDGSLLIQQKVMTSIQYQIKIKKKDKI